MSPDFLDFDHRWLTKGSYALVAAEHREMLPRGINLISAAPPSLISNAEKLPALVNLSTLSASQIDALVEGLDRSQKFDEPIVLSALLETGGDERALVCALQRIQIAKGPQGQKAWLRVHDPRVMLQLPRVLHSSWDQWLWPISYWRSCWGGQWFAMKALSTPTPCLSSTFDQATWSELERIGAVNRSLAQLGLGHACDATAYGLTMSLSIERGQKKLALQSINDLVDYASLCHSVLNQPGIRGGCLV